MTIARGSGLGSRHSPTRHRSARLVGEEAIAGIADAVTVAIGLIPVRGLDAVVDVIADAVAVDVTIAIHAAFVDEHRDEWEPTFMTWLLLGPALLVVRVLWRAGAARLSPSTLTTWNWRLEVALTFWLMGAALVIAALAWELAS